ncbi:MAG: FecR family protein [Acidobacteriota bacterium]
MKKINSVIFGAIVFAVSTVVLYAQDPTITSAAGGKYLISAKAGGVNFVEGNVGIVRKSGPSGRLLRGDMIEIGDRVSTAADGRAEILLNPGSYVRIGGNAAFEFKTTSLDDLQIKLDRGSAILEVYAGNDFLVTISSPKAKFKLINSGVFRLDVTDGGAGTLSVWKGRAQVGNTDAGIIKAGRSMTVFGSNVSIAKFERDKGDELDQWSKGRGKQLAKLTNSLQKRDLRQALMSSYNGRQWNVYNSFGLWVFDRFSGSYCFLPFGYGWYSPYGYGYDRYMGWYDLPWTVYNPPTMGGGTPPPGTTNPSPVPVNTPIVSAGDRSGVPPFVRMQGGFGSGRDGGDSRGSGNDAGSPVYSPPVYSPPPPSAPVSLPGKVDSPAPPTTGKDGE